MIICYFVTVLLSNMVSIKWIDLKSELKKSKKHFVEILVHAQGWSSSDCPVREARAGRIWTFWEIKNKTIIENPSILFKKKTDMFMHDVVLNGDVPIDLDFDRMFVDTELIDGGLWKGWQWAKADSPPRGPKGMVDGQVSLKANVSPSDDPWSKEIHPGKDTDRLSCGWRC